LSGQVRSWFSQQQQQQQQDQHGLSSSSSSSSVRSLQGLRELTDTRATSMLQAQVLWDQGFSGQGIKVSGQPAEQAPRRCAAA
jgi:FKBP-type peptidyl-prolyl cis-trans isomerase (trigger factor)